jgi:hypothetical protein
MSQDFQRRMAYNEDLFREVNEGIVRGQWPGDPESPIGFRCECARLGCNVLLALTVSEYERVRADPRRFLMVSGHELPEVEVVVERQDRYIVVEKIEAAGEEAEALDSRP